MSLENISPIDGRYSRDTFELRQFFSEQALIKLRVMLEIEYLIALSKETDFFVVKKFSELERDKLRGIYLKFSQEDAEQIKTIEDVTKHDVKAVEYFLQSRFVELGFEKLIPYIHFALTSEDINNLAYVLSWKHSIKKSYLPNLKKVLNLLQDLSHEYKSLSLLAMTHGQPATTTTLGKEMSVYTSRLERQIEQLEKHDLQAKLNGAVGNFAAHHLAFPDIDWIKFSKKFVNFLGLDYLEFSTQVNSYDSLSENFAIVSRINTILLDLSIDMWLYISRGVFNQVVQEDEVGSSTMPQKVNPINFENAEGNIGMANNLFNFLINKLPQSRLQRDLSGSTVIRNQGVALAHSLLTLKNLVKGLNKVVSNEMKIRQELQDNFSIIAEGLQTVLRKYGEKDAYEKIKSLTRGKDFTRQDFLELIEGLDLPEEEKVRLRRLRPDNYVGVY